MIPAMGLAMAVGTLVGQNIGAGNIERAARIGRLGSWMGFWALTALGVLAFLFAPRVVAFFVPGDAGVIAEGATYLRIMALTWGFVGAQFSMTGVLRASGNMIMTMMITLVSQWVLQFPLAYVLSTHTSLREGGIWWAFPISNVIVVLVTAGIYAKGDWKRTRLVGDDDRLAGRIASEVNAEEGRG